MQVIAPIRFDHHFGRTIQTRRTLKRSYSVAFAPSHPMGTTLSTPVGVEVTLTPQVAGSLFVTRSYSEPAHTFQSTRQQLPLPDPIDDPMQETIADEDVSTEEQRASSPAPTEIIDESELLRDQPTALAAMGIKVRDYALQPSSRVRPAREIFDYQHVCAEYDFLLDRNDRAVPGKTLRRLLDLGFITDDEQRRRWRAMDHEELRRYDARPSQVPSKGIPGDGVHLDGPPSQQLRAEWLNRWRHALHITERSRNKAIAIQERVEHFTDFAQEIVPEHLRRMIEDAMKGKAPQIVPDAMDVDQPSSAKGLGKRPAPPDDEEDHYIPATSTTPPGSPKRQRLTPPPSPASPALRSHSHSRRLSPSPDGGGRSCSRRRSPRRLVRTVSVRQL